MTDNAPTPHLEDQPVDTYTDLTARLAAADLGWSHEHGDPPANPDYIKRLAFQVMAFKPPLIAGVYVDDEMLDDMRDRLHGDNCGCGEWDSHSQEYVERMDETIHAVLYPLRHPVRPVSQGTEDSPEVVCICGSMRFRDLMLAVAADETAAGRIVLMPFAVVAPVDQGSGFKRMLDTLHRRKIDLAGRVIVVMDESGYYGESTRGEIEYASKTGKVVSFQAVERTAEDSDYREQIARALLASSDSRTDLSGTHDIQIITADAAAELHDRVVSPLVEQLRQARAAYNRMAGHAVDRAAERDRYYLAWQSAARGRRQARVERDTARNQFLDHYNGTAGQLDRIRELQDALRERTGQRDEARQELAGEKHVRRLNEHGLLGQLAALRSTAVVLPEDWREQVAAKFGYSPRRDGELSPRALDVAELIESWRAAPVEATSKQLRVAPKRGCCVGMPGDLTSAIRERMLADALGTFKATEVAQHYADCTVRYAGALKAVLDEVDTWSDAEIHSSECAQLIVRKLSTELGVTEEVDHG